MRSRRSTQRSSPRLEPRPQIPPEQLRAAILAEKARRSGSRSFSAFVRQAWQFVPQVDPLVWNWHMDAMCDHYEEVAYGRIPKLVVNCPPGHAKSVLQAVLWPAWIWTWWPKCQFLFASYSDEFALRDAGRCRDVILSDWYQETYAKPGGWELRQDQSAKSNFANTAGGVRFSTSIGGAGAGLRAHIIGIDDPLNIKDAASQPAIEEANDFIGKTLSQRFVDARNPRIAMVMQRLGENDPTWFVLSGGAPPPKGEKPPEGSAEHNRRAGRMDWQNLRMPSEFEESDRCATYRWRQKDGGPWEREIFWTDPRHAEGDLLFAERFTREVLEAARLPNALGEDGYAGQHQQRPTPKAGLLFKIADWRFWREAAGDGDPGIAPRPKGCYEGPARVRPIAWDKVILSIDCNFRKTKAGSFAAIHVWAQHEANRFLLHVVKERFDFEELCRAIVDVCALYPEARERVIELKANGDAIMSRLNDKIGGFIGFDPETDKEARASAGSLPLQRAGNVYLLDGAPWVPGFIGEHAGFPKGKRNDDVDACSQAQLYFSQETSTADYWARARGSLNS